MGERDDALQRLDDAVDKFKAAVVAEVEPVLRRFSDRLERWLARWGWWRWR